MNKAYIYPANISKQNSNPYISDFVNSLSNCTDFININRASKLGILDLFRYLGKIDVIFLNWIEDLPDKKFGLLQAFLFIPAIYILKFRKRTIFYTLHNKQSHYKKRNAIKKLLSKFVLSKADYVLFHSKDGFKLLNEIPYVKGRKIFMPHPFRNVLTECEKCSKIYDILIWGSIRPYKGIHSYLQFIHSKQLQNKYKTLIIGDILPAEYENELMKYTSETIRIINEFVPDDKLNKLIDQASIVLFTYNENSVLSSGALIYSLSRGALIIGPNTGSFRDANEEGIIDIYNDFDDLIIKIDKLLNVGNIKSELIEKYILENTWNKFGAKIIELICSKLV